MKGQTAGMATLDSTGNTFPPLFDVGAVWARLWQRRWLVLAAIGGAFALALLYLAVTAPTYTATASPRSIRAMRAPPSSKPSCLASAPTAAVASQVFVIEFARSPDGGALDDEGIAQDEEFADGGLLSLVGLSGETSKDAIFRRFERRVTVERAGLTYGIDVSFKSRSAAARRASPMPLSRLQGRPFRDRCTNADVNSRLADRVAALQKVVSEADRAVSDFRVQHEILDAAAGGTPKDQIDQLTTQLIEARASADAAKGKYDQALAAGTSPAGLEKLSEIVSPTRSTGRAPTTTSARRTSPMPKRSTRIANGQSAGCARNLPAPGR